MKPAAAVYPEVRPGTKSGTFLWEDDAREEYVLRYDDGFVYPWYERGEADHL